LNSLAIAAVLGALFCGCLLATVSLTPLVMRFAHWVGAVDRGGFRKVYRGDIPLLGGLGIAVPFLLLCVASGLTGMLLITHWEWVWRQYRDEFTPLMNLASYRMDFLTLAAGGIAVAGLGLLDDTKELRARWKLLGQVTIASFVCLAGYGLNSVAVPFLGTIELGLIAGTVLTMLWIVGLINAFNLIDGIDGLASGIALVGASALVVMNILEGNLFIAFAGAALAGSVLAFLLFNFPPAKMFLGDTGSMFLGYVLAMLSLLGTQKSEAAVIVFAPMLALSLPIFETMISMTRRYLRGVPIFSGDNRHTHHRLLRKGYSQPRVVLTLCGTGLLLAIAAILAAVIPDTSDWAWTPYALYIGTLVNIAWLAGYLRPTNVRAALERRQRNRVYQAFGKYARIRLNGRFDSQIAPIVLDLCRQELGLHTLSIRTRGGKTLAFSPAGTAAKGTEPGPEELHVKSATGQDVLIHYAFKDTPDAARRYDVSFTLAGIFDGMPLAEIGAPAGNEAEAQYQAKIVNFRNPLSEKRASAPTPKPGIARASESPLPGGAERPGAGAEPLKILILSPRLPHAQGKADSMTVYRLVRFLSQRHEVSLACFYDNDAELAHVPELERLCKEVRCIRLNKARSAFNMACALPLPGLPLQVAYYRDGRMRRAVRDMIARHQPDLAYAHLIRMGEYLRGEKGMPRVLAMQISQTLNYGRMIANVPSLLYKTLYTLEFRRVRRYEPAITKSFETCLLISKHDKQSLAGHENIHNIFYSPHGVDVAYYTPEGAVEKEDAVLFCGVLETPTNMDAVLYFYRDIYPLVKAKFPGVKLYLAGKNPPASISKIAEEDPSVVVTGYLKDIRPYYMKAKVGIDPLRIGAGLQNKLLVGMSMAQPMVCTTIANEGIAAEHGKHVLVADTPEAFADAVVELLQDNAKAEAMGAAARRFIEDQWSWEYYFEQLEDHFGQLTQQARHGGR
jgi:UDP-GlcNAc:undecaprenyl-phosphate GlcNAc-1-phosphate transferase